MWLRFNSFLVSSQLMALLLLRHALSLTTADGDDDASTFFSVSRIWVFQFVLEKIHIVAVFN